MRDHQDDWPHGSCELLLRVSLAGMQECLGVRDQDRRPSSETRQQEFVFTDACTALLRRYAHGKIPADRQEDFVQRVWLRLLAALPRFAYNPAQGTISSWVLSLARRERAEWMRHSLPKAGRPTVTGGLGESQSPTDPHDDADPALNASRHEDVRRGEKLMAIIRARASEPSMRALYLHVIDERSFQQIADELHVTVKRVRNLCEQAVDELLRSINKL